MGLLSFAFILAPVLAASDDSNAAAAAPLILLLSGFIYFGIIYSRYRNADKRHLHERETTVQLANVQAADQLLQHRKGLSNAEMKGANNLRVEGALSKEGDLNKVGDMAGSLAKQFLDLNKK